MNDERKFGYYKCPRCEKTWTSGYSWRDITQQCKKCKIPVKPYRQVSILIQSKNQSALDCIFPLSLIIFFAERFGT